MTIFSELLKQKTTTQIFQLAATDDPSDVLKYFYDYFYFRCPLVDHGKKGSCRIVINGHILFRTDRRTDVKIADEGAPSGATRQIFTTNPN